MKEAMGLESTSGVHGFHPAPEPLPPPVPSALRVPAGLRFPDRFVLPKGHGNLSFLREDSARIGHYRGPASVLPTAEGVGGEALPRSKRGRSDFPQPGAEPVLWGQI